MRASDRAVHSDLAGDVEELLSQIQFVEITPRTVDLLYSSPPARVRTLDAIHLATLVHLHGSTQVISLATYDRRLAAAAASMGFTVITP